MTQSNKLPEMSFRRTRNFILGIALVWTMLLIMVLSWTLYQFQPLLPVTFQTAQATGTLYAGFGVLWLLGLAVGFWVTKQYTVQRKALQQALTRSETRYWNLVDGVLLGLYRVDAMGQFLEVNLALVDILGYPDRASLLAENLFSMYVDVNQQEHWRYFINEHDTAHNLEMQLRRYDGNMVCCLHNTRVIRDKQGEVQAFEGSIEDITERKKSLAEIKRLKEFNEEIVQNISEGILLQDVQGNITFVNPATATMLGYTPQELIGKHWTTITPPDQYHVVEQADQRRREGKSDHYELEIICKDGSRLTVITSGSPRFIDKTFVGTLAVLTDITEQKQDETALANINEELEYALLRANELAVAAEKANQAKSEFLANMSHEIRTPMNGIIGMTELALGTTLTDEQRDYLLAVQTSAEALLSLLNDILDFSKIEAGKLELEEIDFDLGQVVEQLADIMVQRAVQKNLELLLYLHPDITTAVRGDPLRLRQVLVNLVGNAIKFTDEGEVVVEIEQTSQDDETIEFRCSVSDTGIGIPEEKKNLVFESFAQADGSTTRRYGGTGLGLAISKQLVELMGGHIQVDSKVGRGSKFTFTIILKRGKTKPVSQPHQSSLEGLRVLCIDDNATNRRILRDTLHSFGCKPEVVADGSTGLNRLLPAADQNISFDLVLIDVQMPQMNGIEVLQVIRRTAQLAHLPVVLLTSVDNLNTVASRKDLNWSAYLTKPIKQSQLLNAMMIAVGQATPTDTAGQTLPPAEAVTDGAPSLRILLAEDNEINRRLATIMFEREGYHVVCAENGRVALSLLEQQEIDLIFMDVQMPEMDGLEATAAIRAETKWANIPIIAMTAHAMKGDREHFLSAGMDDYVTKPIRTKEVLAAIERQRKRIKVSPPAPPSSRSNGRAANAELEILDPTGPMEWLDGDTAVFGELLTFFLNESKEYISQLAVAIANADAQQVNQLAHKLKGSSANMGANRLSAAAHQLEQIGASEDLSGAEATLTVVRQEMIALIERASAFLGDTAASTTVPELETT